MTINEILAEYFNSGKLRRICNTYTTYATDDLASEIICILSEYDPPEKIIELYEVSELDPFIKKIARNQVCSGKFYRQYIRYVKQCCEYEESIEQGFGI